MNADKILSVSVIGSQSCIFSSSSESNPYPSDISEHSPDPKTNPSSHNSTEDSNHSTVLPNESTQESIHSSNVFTQKSLHSTSQESSDSSCFPISTQESSLSPSFADSKDENSAHSSGSGPPHRRYTPELILGVSQKPGIDSILSGPSSQVSAGGIGDLVKHGGKLHIHRQENVSTVQPMF